MLKSTVLLLGIAQTNWRYRYGHIFSYSNISQRKRSKFCNMAGDAPDVQNFLLKLRRTFRIPISSSFQTRNTAQNVHSCFKEQPNITALQSRSC